MERTPERSSALDDLLPCLKGAATMANALWAASESGLLSDEQITDAIAAAALYLEDLASQLDHIILERDGGERDAASNAGANAC